MSSNPNVDPRDGELRDHTYDGIQEFDKRLPNWWLFTLHGAIIFAIAYWGYYEWTGHMVPADQRVETQLAEISRRALLNGATLTDDQLWTMSRDAKVVASGEKIYMSNCLACHGDKLQGGIGANLSDNQWIHGGEPTKICATVTSGVTDKGMPVWGPVLGPERIAEVVAFILSRHQPEGKPQS